MKKILIMLMVVAMASFLFVGCLPITPPIPDEPVDPDEPGVYLVGIEVAPEEMDLYVGEKRLITSVTASYEVRVYGADIALEDCIFLTSDKDIATVSKVGEVEAIAKGTTTILVGYEGKIDTLEVTVERAITITWFEDFKRYEADGSPHSTSINDPNGPATLAKDDGGWRFADVNEVYNASGDLIPFSGNVFITETGLFSGYTTYYLYKLETENIFVGQVEIIVYEDGISGTMVGTYTQFKYAYAESEEEMEILLDNYPEAIECVEDEGKWFVQYTDYTAYPR